MSLALLGIVVFVAIGVTLEKETGLPFDTLYRIGCAAVFLGFIGKLISDYPRERWPWIGLWLALLVNIDLFFTPLFARSTSRGEIMLFALPDAIILLVARIASYSVSDEHQRAMRQQMILGLIVAVAFCAALFVLVLVRRAGH